MNRWNRLEKSLFVAFLLWSGAGLLFTLLGISPAEIAQWPLSNWLRQFIDFCLETGDPILILLAFANTHLHAARQWTPAIARRWALIVLAFGLAVETLGACTAFPFGSYHYTDHFGPLLGVVPFTIPLAWHVVVTNALFLIRSLISGYLPRVAEAALTGAICMTYDFILEPFATETKHYWIWKDSTIPVQNFIAWFVLSALLTWFFAPTFLTRFPRDPRPAVIFAATLIIFIAGGWL